MFKAQIRFEGIAAEKLRKAMDRFQEAMRNKPELEAKMRAAVHGFKCISAGVVSAGVKEMIRIVHITNKDYYEEYPICNGISESSEYLARALREISARILSPEEQIDQGGGGQGIVFRSIGRWFLPGRFRQDAKGNPGKHTAAIQKRWSRGRTAKSTKAPVRLKGWRGRR